MHALGLTVGRDRTLGSLSNHLSPALVAVSHDRRLRQRFRGTRREMRAGHLAE